MRKDSFSFQLEYQEVIIHFKSRITCLLKVVLTIESSDSQKLVITSVSLDLPSMHVHLSHHE